MRCGVCLHGVWVTCELATYVCCQPLPLRPRLRLLNNNDIWSVTHIRFLRYCGGMIWSAACEWQQLKQQQQWHMCWLATAWSAGVAKQHCLCKYFHCGLAIPIVWQQKPTHQQTLTPLTCFLHAAAVVSQPPKCLSAIVFAHILLRPSAMDTRLHLMVWSVLFGLKYTCVQHRCVTASAASPLMSGFRCRYSLLADI